MKKATFIDFEDSFTYNLVQELTEVGFSVEIISWQDFEKLPDEGLLVLGPGPGHPDDYIRIFDLLKTWINQKRPLFGVCLGHQLYWRILGEDIIRSKEPLHGQKVKLDLTHEWKEWFQVSKDIVVQRYNSLAVLDGPGIRNSKLKNFIQNDEVLISRGEGVITYQFHPESIGTTYRKALLGPVFRDLV